MLQERIAFILKGLAEDIYPGVVKPFTVEVHARELRSKHGDYNGNLLRIRVFNLSRPTSHIIATSIHEAAHHLDYCLRGTTGHDQHFYIVFRDLIAGAVRKGIVDYQVAKEANSSRSMGVLERKFGPLLDGYRELDKRGAGNYLVKVTKAFSVKEHLKKRFYRWSDIEVCWCKEIPGKNVTEEKMFLETILKPEQVDIRPANEITIDAVYHIIVSNAYDKRELLRHRDYLFNGFGYSNNVWVIRIPAQRLDEERRFLSSIGCRDYKIEGRSSPKKPPQKIRD